MKKITLLVFANIFVSILLSQNGDLPDGLKIGKHTVSEWNHIIDATWGEGRSTAQAICLMTRPILELP